MALTFEAFPKLGKPGGNVARDLGGVQCRIKAVGIGPDQPQQIAGFLASQVVQMDAITVAIRELVIALPLPRKIGVKLDHVANVHDHQEGRPAIFFGHGARIAVGLIAGLEHGVVKAGCAALAVTGLPWRIGLSQHGKLIHAVATGLVAALLGLKDETTPPIQVDAPAPFPPCMGKGHRAFEAVVVVLPFGVGDLDRIDAKKLDKLARETLEIRHFIAARGTPAVNEPVQIRH